MAVVPTVFIIDNAQQKTSLPANHVMRQYQETPAAAANTTTIRG
jgi:hypothetical protein